MDFDLIANIALGLDTALSARNLMFCLLGVSLGMFIGVIPGVGPLTAISMLMPLTFYLDPTAALIMLGGIYYGTAYGGSTSAILLNVPGTTSSSVACLDGYPMSRQGRAGVALMMTTLGSFVGGSVGILIMMIFSPMIVAAARGFGGPEYFALILLGFVCASTISSGSLLKGLAMIGVGILLGGVGMDLYSGAARFTMGALPLIDGISLAAIAMGLFGIGEIISSVGTQASSARGRYPDITLRSMLPTRDDVRRSWMPMVRGAGIGSFFGILPGAGGTISAFMAYAVEKRVSKDPARFGQGAIEGVVAPETANNAADQTAFIPTLTLGIPGSATMAVILAIFIIHGITPGPKFVTEHPDMFWGLIMSFWLGNLMLLVLNIPLIGVWVRILTIPYHILYPAIVVFVGIGAYAINNSTFDIFVVVIFGLAGYVMRLLDLPAAPLLLGFVLGPMLEENFRRSMIFSRGSFGIFVDQPISLALLLVTLVVLVYPLAARLRRRTFVLPGAGDE